MVIAGDAALIVVDTSVWIDWINEKTTEQVDKLRQGLGSQEVVVGDIILLEVLQGARDDVHARRIERRLNDCVQMQMLNKPLVSIAAANLRHLRCKGITIRKTPDLNIGTWCIENDCPLLHNDRDFLPMVEHLGLKEF